jgi:hypothetical protein
VLITGYTDRLGSFLIETCLYIHWTHKGLNVECAIYSSPWQNKPYNHIGGFNYEN